MGSKNLFTHPRNFGGIQLHLIGPLWSKHFALFVYKLSWELYRFSRAKFDDRIVKQHDYDLYWKLHWRFPMMNSVKWGCGRRTAEGRRWTVDGGRQTVDGGRRTADGGRRTADGAIEKVKWKLNNITFREIILNVKCCNVSLKVFTKHEMTEVSAPLIYIRATYLDAGNLTSTKTSWPKRSPQCLGHYAKQIYVQELQNYAETACNFVNNNVFPTLAM